jgi:hypothetical protein
VALAGSWTNSSELLSGDVEHLHLGLGEGVSDGMEEVCLPEATLAVDEQGVMSRVAGLL